jgi:glycosyltransferase involved in cell wall biosynthesis
MHLPLKVLINAQMTPGGGAGGIEQFLMGLVSALGHLTDGDEQYILITRPESPDWLDSLLGPNQRAVAAPRRGAGRSERAKQLLGPLRRPAGKLLRGVRRFVGHGRDGFALPQSDGFYESLGGDIIHFPYQEFVRCRLPAIFNPHDLLHRRYPMFFEKTDIVNREALYRGACYCAQAVAAESGAVKLDLEQYYGLDSEKIFVVHRGAPTALLGSITSETLREVQEKFALPPAFAFFPAQTWPHKNHLRLLEAIRMLGDRDWVTLHLVCTGTQNEHWPAIQQCIANFELQKQVMFLGFVKPIELRALYHLAQFVVFPSLFEGGGFPVVEAFQEEVPVTCSDLPPLREYGGDAVLTFDPLSTESIASSLLRMATDAELRGELRERGKERARRFTWERTAKTYRALYRKVAGVPLSEEDVHLLSGTT